jgi:Ca-activated chloride channel homolog
VCIYFEKLLVKKTCVTIIERRFYLMKNFACILLLICLSFVSISAQSGRSSRPRIVSLPNAPTPTPEIVADKTTTIQPPISTDTPTSGEIVDESDDEVITVETDLVTLPVSVTDRDGRFVPDLKQRDFEIFEDGKLQKIEYFASVDQPFTVVLLIDVSNSTSFKIDEIRSAAIAFTRQLGSEDKLMVVSFDSYIRVLCEPTSDRSIMREAILKANFAGGTSLYDAVDYSIGRLKNVSTRSAIVIFTDGVDTTSKETNASQTMREAEQADAPIYPVRYDTFGDMNGGTRTTINCSDSSQNSGGGILGKIVGGILNGGNVQIGNTGQSGSSKAEYCRGKQYLEDIARVSGGKNFVASNYSNLETSFSGIAEELRKQYNIGYYPEIEGKKGQRRQVKVRTMSDSYKVRTKDSYIVGDGKKKTK